MEVNQFLSSLTNLEKTRNFNVFKEYSLDGFRSALKDFGVLEKPNDILRISVVGTNGKGSTAYFLSQIFLQNSQFSPVGLYTSPHLLTQNERIQVNGNLISDSWMNQKLNSFSARELERLKTFSYFEFFTLFSILYFKDNDCKTEIYEAGLGGRLDATRLVNPDIVVLTKITLDHTEILGDTAEKILLEKLQIAGTNAKFMYTFLQDDHLLTITKSFCIENNIELVIYPYSVSIDYLSFNKMYALFIMNSILQNKKQPLMDENILSNIPNMNGRMQLIRKEPILLFDIGHNPSAIEYLLQSVEISYSDENKWDVYIGLLKDKNLISVLEILSNHPKIKKINLITGGIWNEEDYKSEKINRISEEEFFRLVTNTDIPSLVLGSFRLYPLVKKNVL